MNSTQFKQSRYVSGGQTEVNSRALEWWERKEFQRDSSDRQYTIEQTTQNRLDLISKLFLGDEKLAWFIAQYNFILDPLSECIPGRVLFIPEQGRINTMLRGQLGGFKSLREVPLNKVKPIV